MSHSRILPPQFLKSGAAVGGGSDASASALPVKHPCRHCRRADRLRDANAWIRVGSDNSVTILCARSEMGQGVVMALPTLVAEELEVDLDKVKVEIAPAGRGLHQRHAGRPDHGRLDLGARRLGQAARRGRAGAHDARRGRGARNGRPIRPKCTRRRTAWSPDRAARRRPTASSPRRPRSCTPPKEVKLKDPQGLQATSASRSSAWIPPAKIDGKRSSAST